MRRVLPLFVEAHEGLTFREFVREKAARIHC